MLGRGLHAVDENVNAVNAGTKLPIRLVTANWKSFRPKHTHQLTSVFVSIHVSVRKLESNGQLRGCLYCLAEFLHLFCGEFPWQGHSLCGRSLLRQTIDRLHPWLAITPRDYYFDRVRFERLPRRPLNWVWPNQFLKPPRFCHPTTPRANSLDESRLPCVPMVM